MKLLIILIFSLALFACVGTPPIEDPPTVPPPATVPPPVANPGMGYDPNPETGKCSARATGGKLFGKCYTREAAVYKCTHNSFWLYSQECAELAGGKDH